MHTLRLAHLRQQRLALQCCLRERSTSLLRRCGRRVTLSTTLSPATCLATQYRLSSSESDKRVHADAHLESPLLRKTEEGETPSLHSVHDASDAVAKLTNELRQAPLLQARLLHQFVDMPIDRRVLYRDHLFSTSLCSHQQQLREVFLNLYKHSITVATDEESLDFLVSPLVLRRMKTTWLQLRNTPSLPPTDASLKGAYFEEVRGFYSALLCSGLLRSDADVRLLLHELQNTDLLEPDARFYESVFVSLWTLEEAQRQSSTTAEVNTSTPSTASAAAGDGAGPASPADLVAGESRQLRRGVVGDLASHYMGFALAQAASPSASATQHAVVRSETWELFFCTFANAQPAPKLVDLWWARFLDWVDKSRSAAAMHLAEQPQSVEDNGPAALPLPYQAVHAVLAWCAESRDMERALKFFNAVNHRGVALHESTLSLPSPVVQTLASGFAHAGSLTAKSSDTAVQQLQLALLVKLMASTKSVKMDGGLRALVVRDVQRQIDPEVLYTAPWGVLNDLLSGLSVPSAMQLLRRCSLAELPTNTRAGDDETAAEPLAAKTENGSGGLPDKKGRAIPFYIWASLLRRCCREHLQDQAESLFLFLRHKFRLSVVEKRELVEIMMRMYVTMQPADFPSALDLFLQHVLRTPPNDPVVQPDGVLYELLIKGADSRNASMMLFLEACASGVSLTEELFEALMGSTQLKTVASLTRKLPHDYAASSLDAQLKIPADADAHLRREEALRARGKPLYDSTGDAG